MGARNPEPRTQNPEPRTNYFFRFFLVLNAKNSISPPKINEARPVQRLMLISRDFLYISGSELVDKPNMVNTTPSMVNIKPIGKRISTPIVFLFLPEYYT
jgi:hypothetical protein